MAYFDSPKNRAIWKKELDALKAEKERRALNGYRPEEAEMHERTQVRTADRPGRRRINLEQLEAIEREAGGIRRVKRPVRQRSRAKEMESAKLEAQKSGRTM